VNQSYALTQPKNWHPALKIADLTELANYSVPLSSVSGELIEFNSSKADFFG
jgi:hypothetical protein